jgi:hypothetical protein
MAMRPPGASGEYIDGKPVFDYCRCIDQKPFDRRLAVNVINRNLHRSPGSPEEKKDSAALSLGLIDRFIKVEKKVDLVEAFCRTSAGVVGTAFILVTAIMKHFGRDKFIEYMTNYDNYGLLGGVGGAILFMFAYYTPKDVWSAVFSERDD